MKRWMLLGVGLVAYALALFATAPATLADAALRNASAGSLRLADARGSLWSGSGWIEIRDASGQSGAARDFSWRVAPASLLRGQLVCEARLEGAIAPFPVTLSLSRIQVANADLRLPAAVLGLGVARLAPLGLTGDVLIHVASLSVARDAMAGNATVKWLAAGSVLTTVSPLGDYEVGLDAEGRTVRANLRTLEGPLRLDGKGSWTHGGNPEFLVSARVLPQHQEQLAPLLRLIAVERGAGNFELSSNTPAFGS